MGGFGTDLGANGGAHSTPSKNLVSFNCEGIFDHHENRSMDVIVIRGTPDEVIRVMQQLGLQNNAGVSVIPVKEAHGILGVNARIIQIHQHPAGGYRYSLAGRLARKIREVEKL